MSRLILDGMVGQFQRVAGFYDKFIEVCPDKVWAEPFGKFPVWQTAFHAAYCIGFFLGPKDAPVEVEAPYGGEVVMFQSFPPAADKAVMAKYFKEMSAFANSYFASISDVDLTAEHAGFSARVNTPYTVASAITGLVGHHYYHFGMCDAALRQNGLEGLF